MGVGGSATKVQVRRGQRCQARRLRLSKSAFDRVKPLKNVDKTPLYWGLWPFAASMYRHMGSLTCESALKGHVINVSAVPLCFLFTEMYLFTNAQDLPHHLLTQAPLYARDQTACRE